MEGRVKTRQHGSIPNTLGRQVGVLPISGGTKLRRGSGDKIPVGGTDISSDSYTTYQKRPPSGSGSQASRGQSSASKTHGSSLGKNRRVSSGNDSESVYPETPVSAGGEKRSAGSRNSVPSSRGQTSKVTSNSLKKSPGSSHSISSQYGDGDIENYDNQSLVGSARSSFFSRAPSSRISPASSRSAATKTSPGISNMKRSARKSSGTVNKEGDNEREDMEEQDIRFIDVPSQRSRSGSKSKRSPGSVPGSAGQRPQENGKKPYKTIDPEEILAQNMESDFLKIYEINLHASELTNIDNMDKFKKVKVLDLSCNFIEQVQNLDFNRDLKELKLYDNRLRKIDGLENLKELSSLQLQHNKIKSIGKGLHSLKKLKNLRIDCNQLLKIETSELSICVQLTSLDISYNMLDSLTALNYLPNLEEVNASGNRLRSVSDLSKCKRLGEIDLSGNRITDLSGLRGLPKLLTLNISNNQLSSLKTMGRLKSLQDLLAMGNHINELSTVATQLPALEVLDLTDNEITDWDEFYYLEEMSELVELFISGNPFCALDGPMPHYYSAIQAVLPDLEIIDGAHIKKHVAKGAPLMRPMSASTIVSLRQMDTQMKGADEQMKSLEQSLEQKFASIRATCDTLPAESPRQSFNFGLSSGEDTPLSSRCSSRSRILEARKFAAAVNKK
ncbi:protein phosphatase 1 regulatory subunit 7-like [Mercenaria mercenaria]|uniref:protein phosphatase 1 regulatory subunit 7-like n=1 Tax=Mercenaria mercenaria TaxID=6596 RepID=UPI00234F895E|nr:protein phosphatase 1 regulatory subunit 7-like [Mercenaria mercenaria]